MSKIIPDDFTGIVESWNGTKLWYQSGIIHREDGPAVEWPDGFTKKYYMNGKELSQESWQEKVDKINGKNNKGSNKMKLIHSDGKIEEKDLIPDNFTGIVEYRDRTKEWYQDGKRHRLDGPAVEWSSEFESYYINGKCFLTQKSWQEEVDKINKKSLNKIKLIHSDGKIEEVDNDCKFNVLNCFTGVVECSNGSKYWYQNGKLHRLDGPAVEWSNGDKSYYINGKYYECQESWQEEVDKIIGKNNNDVCSVPTEKSNMENKNNNKLFALIPLTESNIQAGMVIRRPAHDDSIHAFSDTIVEFVDFNKQVVKLVRPYASFDRTNDLEIKTEKNLVPFEIMFRKDHNWHYVMEGSKPYYVL
jgi:uncharacterized protein YlzI (FlbEa/FlbD family)